MATYMGVEPAAKKPYYFISYNTEDAQRIAPTVRFLASHGVPVWYDYGIPYDAKWKGVIAAKIDDSDGMILFYTNNIIGKENSFVLTEYAMARIYQRRIIVVLLDEIPLSKIPHDKVEWIIELQNHHLVKAYTNTNSDTMSDPGWMHNLLRGVESMRGEDERTTAEQPMVLQPISQEIVENDSAENLMKRAFLSLEDEKFDRALEYINRVLDIDAEYAPAYIGKVLVQYKLKSEKALTELDEPLEDNLDWQRALRFADEKQKETYAAYEKIVRDNSHKYANDGIEAGYQCGISYMNQHKYDLAISLFSALEDYRDSQTYLRMCIEAKTQQQQAQEVAERDKDYYNAVRKMNQGEFLPAISAFSTLIEYKESRAFLRKCIDAYYQQAKNYELCVAAENVKKAEHDVVNYQAMIETRKVAQALQIDIKKYEAELGETRGLLNGRKRRELEEHIRSLKQRLTEIQKALSEDPVNTYLAFFAEDNFANAKSSLTAAQAKQARIEAKWQEREVNGWSDEAIIAFSKSEPFTRVGNIVEYGHYAQSKSGKDTTKIEWIVIKHDSENGLSLLLSRYGLDAHRFDVSTYQGWDRSEIRGWLNNEFLMNAFSTEEQKGITTVALKTESEKPLSWGQTKQVFKGGSDTQDSVFLLSNAEISEVSNDLQRTGVMDILNCSATDYATTKFTVAHQCTPVFSSSLDNSLTYGVPSYMRRQHRTSQMGCTTGPLLGTEVESASMQDSSYSADTDKNGVPSYLKCYVANAQPPIKDSLLLGNESKRLDVLSNVSLVPERTQPSFQTNPSLNTIAGNCVFTKPSVGFSWWLRSPSRTHIDNASTVDVAVVNYDGQPVDQKGVLVRPAIWLNLDSADIYH